MTSSSITNTWIKFSMKVFVCIRQRLWRAESAPKISKLKVWRARSIKSRKETRWWFAFIRSIVIQVWEFTKNNIKLKFFFSKTIIPNLKSSFLNGSTLNTAVSKLLRTKEYSWLSGTARVSASECDLRWCNRRQQLLNSSATLRSRWIRKHNYLWSSIQRSSSTWKLEASGWTLSP